MDNARWHAHSCVSGRKNGYPTGYPPAPSCGVLLVSLKINYRRSEYFSRHYLIVFKPNRLWYVCTFQIDEVKAKQLVCPIIYRTDRLDGAFQSSEGTITGHIDQTSYR